MFISQMTTLNGQLWNMKRDFIPRRWLLQTCKLVNNNNNNNNINNNILSGCDRPRRRMAVRSYPSPKVRGSNPEGQAATAPEWRPRRATPLPRSGGCAGAGGMTGATPRSRSGGAAVRRYP